jgi:hypothetical protein
MPAPHRRVWLMLTVDCCCLVDSSTRTDQRFSARVRPFISMGSSLLGHNKWICGSKSCMYCGNSCMSMDGGFQAGRAAGKNLQIRTL